MYTGETAFFGLEYKCIRRMSDYNKDKINNNRSMINIWHNNTMNVSNVREKGVSVGFISAARNDANMFQPEFMTTII